MKNTRGLMLSEKKKKRERKFVYTIGLQPDFKSGAKQKD